MRLLATASRRTHKFMGTKTATHTSYQPAASVRAIFRQLAPGGAPAAAGSPHRTGLSLPRTSSMLVSPHIQIMVTAIDRRWDREFSCAYASPASWPSCSANSPRREDVRDLTGPIARSSRSMQPDLRGRNDRHPQTGLTACRGRSVVFFRVGTGCGRRCRLRLRPLAGSRRRRAL